MSVLEQCTAASWRFSMCLRPCPPPPQGTGKWTIQQAAELSVAAPTMEAALDARFLSGEGPCVWCCQAYCGFGGV